jgi:hypothetical protein
LNKLRLDKTLSSLTELDLGKIASQLVSQKIIKNLHTTVIQSIIEGIIEQYITDNISQPIQLIKTSGSLNPAEKRPVFIIAGPPASGKTSIAMNIAPLLQNTGRSVFDLSYVSTDNVRDVLQSKDGTPEQNQQSAGYVHEESCLVAENSLRFFQESCRTRRIAPSLLFECVDPNPEKIGLLSHDDNMLHLEMTQCDPQTTFQRNNARFEKNGLRLTPANVLLESHHTVSNTITAVLASFKSNTNFRFRLFDTNADRPLNNAYVNLNDEVIFLFDSKTGCLVVKRINDFLKTIKMSLNNPDSFNHEQMVYHDNHTMDDIVSQFVSKYDNNIQFTTRCSDGNESVYASYNKENGFCIQDEAIFQAIIAADTEVGQFFASLQSSVSSNTASMRRV